MEYLERGGAVHVLFLSFNISYFTVLQSYISREERAPVNKLRRGFFTLLQEGKYCQVRQIITNIYTNSQSSSFVPLSISASIFPLLCTALYSRSPVKVN